MSAPTIALERAQRRAVLAPGRLRLAAGGGGPSGGRRPGASNAVFGTLVFIAAESMLFAGLVSAFLVLRAQAPAAPPRFPLALTVANLLLLLGSGAGAARARDAARAGSARVAARWLAGTAMAGTVFLAVQGVEWTRLVAHGLGAATGPYGGLFATLIGVHGFHVVGGVIALDAVAFGAVRGRLAGRAPSVVTAASLYWQFVVVVWPILWTLLYFV